MQNQTEHNHHEPYMRNNKSPTSMSSPDETDEALHKVTVQKCNSLDSGMTGSSGSSDSNDKTSDEVEEEEEEIELPISNQENDAKKMPKKMPYISGITQTSYEATVVVNLPLTHSVYKPKVIGTTPTPPPRNTHSAKTPSPIPPSTATFKVDASYELPKVKPLKDSEMAKLPSVRDLRLRFGGSGLSPSNSRSNSPNTNGHIPSTNKVTQAKLSNGTDSVNAFKVIDLLHLKCVY